MMLTFGTFLAIFLALVIGAPLLSNWYITGIGPSRSLAKLGIVNLLLCVGVAAVAAGIFTMILEV